jgi:glucose-1-phosphate thymidylyltransferase
MAIVGVIPAAGYAARLQPLPCSKEVCPVGGRPVMDYLVERLHAAGCSELRVVTRPQKHDVAERARHHGAAVVEGSPPTVSASLLLGLAGVAPDATVLFGFPDTIWEPRDGFSRLLDRLDANCDAVLGLFRTPELTRSDVVDVDAEGRLRAVQVKPQEPDSDLIWGCAAARAAILQAGLTRHPEPGALFHALAPDGRVRGLYLSDRWLDVGTREALSAV